MFLIKSNISLITLSDINSHVVPPVTENVTKIVSPEMCRQKSRAPKFPILEISRPWKRERNKGLKQLKHEQGFVP